MNRISFTIRWRTTDFMHIRRNPSMSEQSNKTENNLFHTLMELRGNPRACLFTEPMWGLSMNLPVSNMLFFTNITFKCHYLKSKF